MGSDIKLRFKIKQSERVEGDACEHTIVTVEVDLSTLSKESRNLIADRLVGIDVVDLYSCGNGTEKSFLYDNVARNNGMAQMLAPDYIRADQPTFEALMQAVRENQKEVEHRQELYRKIALIRAEGAGKEYRRPIKEAGIQHIQSANAECLVTS